MCRGLENKHKLQFYLPAASGGGESYVSNRLCRGLGNGHKLQFYLPAAGGGGGSSVSGRLCRGQKNGHKLQIHIPPPEAAGDPAYPADCAASRNTSIDCIGRLSTCLTII